MKKLVILIAVLAFDSVFARCGNLPKMVNNDLVFAQVISRSHMDLDLSLILKRFGNSRVKVFGGEGYTAKTLPDCHSNKVADLNWHNDRMASQWVSGQSQSFTAAYRICFYKYHDEVFREYDICNSEVGD